MSRGSSHTAEAAPEAADGALIAGLIPLRRAAVALDSIGVDASMAVPDPEAVDLMVRSFESVGQLQPVVVDEAHRLVIGRVRVEAARRLGWSVIDATVRTDVPDGKARDLLSLEENTVRGTQLRASQLVAVAKTHLLPLLEVSGARNRESAQARGRDTRWGSGVDGAKFASSIPDEQPDDDMDGAKFAPSIAAVIAAPGPARKKLGQILGTSGDSVEKLLAIDKASTNEALPDEVRELARAELAACDEDGKIDRHYRAVRAAVADVMETDDDRAERERSNRITRLLRPLADAVNVIRALTPEQIADVLTLDDAGEADWEDILELAREAETTLQSLTKAARRRSAA